MVIEEKMICDKSGVEIAKNYADITMDHNDWKCHFYISSMTTDRQMHLSAGEAKNIVVDIIQNGRITT